MEYNASATKHLFWFVETRETARLLGSDIVGRFEEFIKVVYGENTLEQNLDFITDALGTKGLSSREKIRNYFLNDFFKNHCSIYSVTGQATKKRDKYIKQLAEIRAYYPALSHIALQRIELDLDDGVKVNYAKFQEIEVGGEGEKKQKITLLAKI